MLEGMYACEFHGRDASGIAALVFERGRVMGSDGTIDYDGVYCEAAEPGMLDVSVVLSVPADVPLVTGAPARSEPYQFKIDCRISGRGISRLDVDVPGGSVRAIIRFIRDIPHRRPRGAEQGSAARLR